MSSPPDDAWGNLVESTGTDANPYLFAGERYDADLGLIYLRARWYDPSVGRFVSADTFDGYENSPLSLHKYIYAQNDPGDKIDPSGNETLAGQATAGAVWGNLFRIALPIIKAAVVACAAEAVTTTAVGYLNVPLTGTPGPCVPNQTRVQLQQGSHPITVSSVQQALPMFGVSIGQVRAGLRNVYEARYDAPWWKPELDSWAYSAVISLSKQLTPIPGFGGVPIVGNILRKETYYRGKEYRIDIENLRGHNLRN